MTSTPLSIFYSYVPGDVVMIQPHNSVDSVNKFISHFSLDPDLKVVLRQTDPGMHKIIRPPFHCRPPLLLSYLFMCQAFIFHASVTNAVLTILQNASRLSKFECDILISSLSYFVCRCAITPVMARPPALHYPSPSDALPRYQLHPKEVFL